jgi:hypothetical protein
VLRRHSEQWQPTVTFVTFGLDGVLILGAVADEADVAVPGVNTQVRVRTRALIGGTDNLPPSATT